MMFVEFIAPAKNESHSIKCLCALYYLKHSLKIDVASVDQVKNLLVQGRIFKKGSKINYPQALDRLGEKVDTPAKGLWQITPTGEKSIKELLGLPEGDIETQNDTEYLEKLIATKIKDPQSEDYFSEGADCLKIGRLRACVVFLWSGAIHEVREKIIKKYSTKKINTAINKHDKKARKINTVDDFAYIKDSILLLASKELGLFDKNEYSTLANLCLDLRNKCGHPSKYSPGPKRVSAFIEDLVKIIY